MIKAKRKKLLKVLLCVILSLTLVIISVLIFCTGNIVSAGDGILDSSADSSMVATNVVSPLKFGENGKFKILHLTDLQDVYPMNLTVKDFVGQVLEEEEPDIVILGGDNTVASEDDIELAIEEITDLFVSRQIYFTLVFGNHDHEQGLTDDELLGLYQYYGGEYCLAYDSSPELTGTATHNLTIKSSDESDDVFNLFMFDSNEYEVDGYGSVCQDQIELYNQTFETLALGNGGNPVPSLTFQHIIVRNVLDQLFWPNPIKNDVYKSGIKFAVKRFSNYTGSLNELCCPGYYDHGQLDAMNSNCDVLAIFSGHDHMNSFSTTIDDIDIVNTAGCTYYSYGKHSARGCRIITLDESDLTTYTTKAITIAEYAGRKNSTLTQYGDINSWQAFWANIFS